MEPQPEFNDLRQKISAALVTTTRSASQLSAEDLGFHRSLDRSVATALDRQNGRLLSLAARLISTATAGSDAVGPALHDGDAVESNWKGVVDVIDSLLEKVDTSLDEFTGAVKRLSPAVDQAQPARTRRGGVGGGAKRFRTQDLPKPQLLFEHVPRNKDKAPFRPLLTSKPHAIVPLDESLRKLSNEDGSQQFQHPYQTEIERCVYPASVYAKSDPVPFKPFNETTAIFVDTPEGVASMLEELRSAKEIAVDLEHHDARSYVGLVCLMQISTRERDWIVDTLKPWRRKLECLNEVFADPNILKVLHGAYMDIIWLQRDLGIYVVGLFDTHHAARTLGYTGASLAFLLQKFANFTAQKQYQMADWRIRPLPTEMFDYARSDTHFLLNVYDNMRNELVERSYFSVPDLDRVTTVLEKSKECALQRYEHPIYDELRGIGSSGWYKLLSKTPALFSKEQFSVFRAVHQWRDWVSREEDESTNYVLPNHALFTISRTMPMDRAAVFNVAQPVSQPLRLRVDDLVLTVSKAKAAGIDGPEMTEIFAQIENTQPLPILQVPSAQPPLHSTNSSLHTPANTAQSIRTNTSSFWGDALQNGSDQQTRSISTVGVQLAIPLPPLTAAIFAEGIGLSDEDAPDPDLQAEPGARAEHPFLKETDRVPALDPSSDVFTIRSLGGPRKRFKAAADPGRQFPGLGQRDAKTTYDPRAGAVSNASPSASADHDPETDQAAAAASARGQRRRAKKLAKRLRKQQAAQQMPAAEPIDLTAVADVESSDPPPAAGQTPLRLFDYATAPSVLHARPVIPGSRGDVENKTRLTPFNPYARAADAKGGLKRNNMERAGRSATFKE